jgi:hypothetical protein
MRALEIYAGPAARLSLAKNGLEPTHIRTIAAAAGGPKGLMLGPLDRFVFGQWLAQSQHTIDLVGASIGAWRMATACLDDSTTAFARLEHDYIHQHYELAPGQKRPTADFVSETFGKNLSAFFSGHIHEVLDNPRYRLHIITSRGRHLLKTEHPVRTPLGYLGAFLTNAVHRKSMGIWLDRVVFSAAGGERSGARAAMSVAPLPFATADYPTRQIAMNATNFKQALQASCSIPFVLRSVRDIPGAPKGAYWDGGITDYHLHLNYAAAARNATRPNLVLYPHFQRSVVPGWLDKGLNWRHRSTHFLDNMLLLAPNPEWIKTLPKGKLPDRKDFTHYGNDLAGRVKAWTGAVSASGRLAEEFAQWLEKPDLKHVKAL